MAHLLLVGISRCRRAPVNKSSNDIARKLRTERDYAPLRLGAHQSANRAQTWYIGLGPGQVRVWRSEDPAPTWSGGSAQRTTPLKMLRNLPRYARASPTFSGRFALPVVARCGPFLAVDALAGHGSFQPPLSNLRARTLARSSGPDAGIGCHHAELRSRRSHDK
jgi:hypothetical protein